MLYKLILNQKCTHIVSSLRRIFERGGPGNLRIVKTKKKISPLKISPFSRPKLGEDRKKRSSLKFKSGFWPKKKSSPSFFFFVCSNFLPKLQRGGHAALLHTNLCEVYPGDSKGGGVALCPPKYAPAYRIYEKTRKYIELD